MDTFFRAASHRSDLTAARARWGESHRGCKLAVQKRQPALLFGDQSNSEQDFAPAVTKLIAHSFVIVLSLTNQQLRGQRFDAHE